MISILTRGQVPASALRRSQRFVLSRGLSSSTPPSDQKQQELAQEIARDVAARQSLEALVKDVGKFAALEEPQIKQLWADYHKDKDFALALEAMDEIKWTKVKERAELAPFFVLPNVRSKGSYFVMVTESKEDFVLMTFLDDYRRIGATANPWCSISFYPEVRSLTLAKVKFAPFLKKDEARALAERWLEFYSDDNKFENGVWVFNKQPEKFDFSKTFPETAPA